MEIYNVKLISGEELICKSKQNLQQFISLHEITLIKPHIIMMTQQGIAASPWPTASDQEEITMCNTSIITVCKATAEIEQVYIKLTSGIDLI